MLVSFKPLIVCFLAISLTENGLFQLGDIANISCSTPVPVESLQWINSYNNSIVREGNVQELVDIRVDSNGTQYFCRVVRRATSLLNQKTSLLMLEVMYGLGVSKCHATTCP